MGHVPLLPELVVIVLVGVVASLLLSRLRLPSAAGLLLAGAVVGPFGLGLVRESEAIEVLAEVGVVLLLFTIGLEFSLERFARIARLVVFGGALQVGLTGAAAFGLATAVGFDFALAVFFGFVFALSSTAIVLRGLADRGETDAPHGRFIVGVLIFQDLCVVPMVLIVPILAGTAGEGVALPLAIALGKAAAVVVGTLLVARVLVPRFFVLVDAARSREVFDPDVALAQPLLVLGLTFAFVGGKAVLATIAAMAMRFPARVAVLAGFGLAQFGEFGFVLVQVADRAGLVDTGELQPLLAAGIVSMFLTPVLVQISPHITAGEMLLRPLERLLGARGADEAKDHEEALADHVIVVGYGVAGRLLAHALRKSDIRYVILELNAETVRKAAAEGEHIYYGDVSSTEALVHAGVRDARAVVVLINDAFAARRGVEALRSAAPNVPVLMRARYLQERGLLDELATDVVYEEVEAGVEMLARVLRRFQVPRHQIRERLDEAREATQQGARASLVPRNRFAGMEELDELEIEKVVLQLGDYAVGRSPADLQVRQETGAPIVAVRRNGKLTQSPDPGASLEVNDAVYVVGAGSSIRGACDLLGPGPRAESAPVSEHASS